MDIDVFYVCSVCRSRLRKIEMNDQMATLPYVSKMLQFTAQKILRLYSAYQPYYHTNSGNCFVIFQTVYY